MKEVRIDGSNLRITYEGAPCDEPAGADVEETAERIVVTTYHEDWSGSCAMSLELHEITVSLAQPVAERPIYDGTCLAASGAPESCRRNTGQP